MASNLSEADVQALKSATQDKYIPISVAGRGNSGEVFHALPREGAFKSYKSVSIAAVRKQICAVKIIVPQFPYEDSPLPAFTREITLLRQINVDKETPAVRVSQLIEYVYSDEVGPTNLPWFSTNLPWFPMTATPGFQMCNLEDVAINTGKPVPKALVAHAFLQLRESLNSLHRRPVSSMKGDLQSINVMVDPSPLDATGFPDFVLIDFGGSILHAKENDRNAERMWFCILIHQFATMGTMNYPEVTESRGDALFHKFVVEVGNVWVDDANFDENFWEKKLDRFTATAEQIKRDASQDALSDIRNRVLAVDKLYNKMPSDGQIRDALRGSV